MPPQSRSMSSSCRRQSALLVENFSDGEGAQRELLGAGEQLGVAGAPLQEQARERGAEQDRERPEGRHMVLQVDHAPGEERGGAPHMGQDGPDAQRIGPMIREELAQPGVSVVIARRACVTYAREIKLLKAFCQSINMRNGIIGNVLAALEKLWNMQKMQDFHDAVIDEVRKESPECAARIVARMARLSAATGVHDSGARV